jgi:hypothetical protein
MSSREILTAGEACTRPSGGISPRGKHGNTSMLELDASEMIETLLVAVGNVAQWIPAPELRRRGTDFIVKGSVEGSSRLADLGGGEGASAGEEGGEECKLHHGSTCSVVVVACMVLVNSTIALPPPAGRHTPTSIVVHQ